MVAVTVSYFPVSDVPLRQTGLRLLTMFDEAPALRVRYAMLLMGRKCRDPSAPRGLALVRKEWGCALDEQGTAPQRRAVMPAVRRNLFAAAAQDVVLPRGASSAGECGSTEGDARLVAAFSAVAHTEKAASTRTRHRATQQDLAVPAQIRLDGPHWAKRRGDKSRNCRWCLKEGYRNGRSVFSCRTCEDRDYPDIFLHFGKCFRLFHTYKLGMESAVSPRGSPSAKRARTGPIGFAVPLQVRSSGAHWAEHCGKGRPHNCKWCYNHAVQKKEKGTSYRCLTCEEEGHPGIYLCAGDCFMLYHTALSNSVN